MAFPTIEKKFKKKCSKCGKMELEVKGNFGHYHCNRCSRMKMINQVNSICIPAHIIKKYGFKNVHLFLQDYPEGILIRKAKEDEIIL